MADKSNIIEIDPDGDVQLQLSLGEDDNREFLVLKVASKTLTLASPVFNKMLNSSFKEGIAKTTKGSVAIPLPEDDSEAMTIICRALHNMNDLVPEQLSTTLLEEIAVLCNKYDCARALMAHGNVWIRNGLDSSPSSLDLDKLLFAACVLDIPAAFAKVGWEFVLARGERIIDLQVGLPALFPHQILRELDNMKDELHQKLINALETPLKAFMTPGQCPASQRVVLQYLQNLHRSSLWPIGPLSRKASLSVILTRIEGLAEPNIQTCEIGSWCMVCQHNDTPKFKEGILKTRQEILNARPRLCLDCLKSEKQTLREGKCRIKHE
ncbi:MAG: hypothetical protein Q9191_003979 [Dirinaria sp. TL-2023a]